MEHSSASLRQPRAVLLHPGSHSGHDLHARGRPRRWECSHGAWRWRQLTVALMLCDLLAWCLCGAARGCRPDSGVGTIYVSDDRGAVFSKSLERHLYTTTGSETDFTAITSLRGVYMTSVLTEGESTHWLHTQTHTHCVRTPLVAPSGLN